MAPPVDVPLGAMRLLTEIAEEPAGPERLHSRLVAGFVATTGADRAALSLLDAGVPRVAASHRLLDTDRAATEGWCPWPADAAAAEPLLVADVPAAPPGSLPVIEGQRACAVAVVPLLSGGRLLGLFTAYFDRPRRFSDADRHGMQAFAAQAAADIEVHRLDRGLRLANLALAATLDAAPGGIIVQGKDGRLLFANRDAAALVGFATPDELLAAEPEEIMARFEVWDEHGTRLSLADLPGQEALRGECPADRLVRWCPAGGNEERWSEISARPVLAGDGRVRFVINVFRDVTERQRAVEALRRSERRLSFLAATSPRLLDSALDYATVLDRIAELFVPDLADVCSVRELAPGGRLHRVASAYSTAISAAMAERLEAPGRDGAPSLLERLTCELPLLVPDVARLPDRPTARALARLGLRSVLAVPLTAGGVPMGDITLLTEAGGRRYDEADLATAEEVARRAGLTAHNARLFQDRSAVASTLQRALLPPALPDLPAIEVAAAYHAASNQIGGDFYDMMPVGPDRWMIASGDVSGKGIEAASLTAMVRYTLRAFARTATRPSGLLARLNDALLPQLDPETFCTVACGLLDVSGDQARVTISLGGHPRPLHVTPGGSVRPVGIPGSLLGILPDPYLADDDLVLQPGDALVVFTDGVGAASPGRGDDRMLRMLRQEAGATAAGLAQAVEVVAQADRGHDDDLSVLVLRRLTPPR